METINEFTDFLDLIISENNLNLSVKEKFIFLPYEKYPKADKTNNKFIVYEDWWIKNPEIVKSKIISILKLSTRVYARECTVKKIDKPVANLFLKENHLYGSVKSKVKYGLFYKNRLYGIITFAGQRRFQNGSRSVELLRFCNKNYCTVVGGFDKLLSAYIKDYQPDTVMTYIDLDWGGGEAFKNLGFVSKEKKEPMMFYVNKQTGERISQKYFNDIKEQNKYEKVFNKGSLKMIKNNFKARNLY
ncbi:MAG: hypothetical protein L3J35_02700 [Bacteroidales bacterium]|nr:hypothetical protein [Bacteroidales bacterium]